MDRDCPVGNCPLDPLSEANASKQVLQMKHLRMILLFTANEQNDELSWMYGKWLKFLVQIISFLNSGKYKNLYIVRETYL